MKKHTILFLAADPAGTSVHALAEEARAIHTELARSGYRDCFELETRWAAQPLDLLRELRKLKPSVVHFCGRGWMTSAVLGTTQGGRGDVVGDHNEPCEDDEGLRSGLFFQGPTGQAQVVTTEALRDTFGAAGSSVQVVVLNACYSEAQADALCAHVDCVVGVRGTISAAGARSFAIGFYGGLGEHESVSTAFRQGCAAIGLEGKREYDRPQLKTRCGIDATRFVLGASVQQNTVSSSNQPDIASRSAAPAWGNQAGNDQTISGGDSRATMIAPLRKVAGLFVVVAALACAAISLFALRPPASSGNNSRQPTPGQITRTPQIDRTPLILESRLRVRRGRDAAELTLDDVRSGDIVVDGDRLQMRVRASRDAHLYIAFCSQHASDPRFPGLAVFPLVGDIPIVANTTTSAPAENADIVLDDRPGQETIYLIASLLELSLADSTLADAIVAARKGREQADCSALFQGTRDRDKLASKHAADLHSGNPAEHTSAKRSAIKIDRGANIVYSTSSWSAVESDSNGVIVLHYELTHVSAPAETNSRTTSAATPPIGR